jgi:hypothetical protein
VRPTKVPTPIRTGEARRSQRTGRLLTRSITRTLTETLAPPRAQMATGTPLRTATHTRTPGAAGRRQAPLLMPHTVGEAAVDRTITAAAHRPHSAAGAVILEATPAGVPDLPAHRAGAVVAAVEAGAAAAVAGAGAGVVRLENGSQASRESGAHGGLKCTNYFAIVRVSDCVSYC